VKVEARNVQQEKRIMRAVVASLDPMDPGLKLKPEYRRKHESGCDPTTGFCSVATEAVWAMLGGNEAGYERRQVRHQGDSHWFVEDVATGRFLDPTSTQFSSPVPYEEGVGRGIPVTRKTGVLYRGDPNLLISRKAAHLIDKATARLLR
jgi:hypothetical protein